MVREVNIDIINISCNPSSSANLSSQTIVSECNDLNTISVRKLYKTILKLHRGLPPELAYMGDRYVKDEFKRHKKATPEQTLTFMESWAVSS